MTAERKTPRLAASACVWRGARVLLVLRPEGAWSLPGGHVEWGEKLIDAARRELAEETGVLAALETHVDFQEVVRGGVHAVVHAFTGPWLSGEAKAASDARDVCWAGVDRLGALPLTPGLKPVILKAQGLLKLRGGH